MNNRYIFKELADNDMVHYLEIFAPLFLKDDFITQEEYHRYKKEKKYFTSWFLIDTKSDIEKPVGWCALADLEYKEPYIGLYGGAVLPKYRGQGLARLMYQYRLDLYPDRGFLVHIQPSNIASLNLAISIGFKPYKWNDPWITFKLRRNS